MRTPFSQMDRGEKALMIIIDIAFIFLAPLIASYIGQLIGWLWGQFMGIVPLVKNVAPWIINRCGTLGMGMSKHTMNVEFYQVSFTITGFWTGLGFALKEFFKDLGD